MLAEHIKWASADTQRNWIQFVYAWHSTGQQLVSYAAGVIDKVDLGGGFGRLPSMWSSQTALRRRGEPHANESTQYFSDQYDCLRRDPGPFKFCTPFSAASSDRLFPLPETKCTSQGLMVNLKEDGAATFSLRKFKIEGPPK
ncbi:MAG: hypothetical protein FJW39_10845 [Acidobacteria bacterium]|nr:hypothetical protein [Acidobacteriota bacterium]